MIKLINPTYTTTTSKYGERVSNTVSFNSLVRLEPHTMKYKYASKDYYIFVPWTYFVFSSYLNIDNVYSQNWRSFSKNTFLSMYFSSSSLDDAFLFRAPISNSTSTHLCFSGMTSHETIDSEKADSILEEFSVFNESEYIQKFNDVYSMFTNDRGNNDYAFNMQRKYDYILAYFCLKLNRKIDSWPKFFSVWQKAGEIPLDLWPSSKSEIDNTFCSDYTDLNIDSVCKLHNLDNNVCVAQTADTLVV